MRNLAYEEGKNRGPLHKLERNVFELRKRRAALDSRLKELREKDTFTFSVAGGAFTGTPLEIARKISEQAPLHNWMPDTVDPEESRPCSKVELLRLLNVHRDISTQRVNELNRKCFSLEGIPSIQTFVELIECEKRASSDFIQLEQITADPLFPIISEARLEDREAALHTLKEFQAAVRSIENHPVEWLPPILRSFLSGQEKTVQQLHALSGKHLNGLAEKAKRSHGIKIELLSTVNRRTLRADATDLLAHLEAGGSLGWGPFRKEVVKRADYILTGVRVNGRPCKTAAVLDELLLWLEVEADVNLLWDSWHGIAERTVGPMPRQVAHLTERHELLTEVLALKPKLMESKAVIATLGTTQNPKWHELASIQRFLSLFEASLVQDSLKRAHDEIEKFCRPLSSLAMHPEAHPVVQRALRAMECRDANEWGSIVGDIEKLNRDREEHTWRCKMEAQLSVMMPRLTAMLRNTCSEPNWEERLAHFEDSWNWARAESWLKKYEREHDITALETERQHIEKQLTLDIAALAATKAWRHCFDRMTNEHRSYLEAWRKEIQKIGKGTGKYAETHRRTAQKYMNRCREAIPAWIMPMYRVAETISPKRHCFDVVIVDEANRNANG